MSKNNNFERIFALMDKYAYVNGFVNHFTTANSIKNLLSGLNVPVNKVKPLFTDEAFNLSLINYMSSYNKFFTGVVYDALSLYASSFQEWKKTGKTKALPERVVIFREFVFDMISEDEKLSAKFGGELGNFYGTKACKGLRKTIEALSINDEDKEAELVVNVLLSIMTRTYLINIIQIKNNQQPLIDYFDKDNSKDNVKDNVKDNDKKNPNWVDYIGKSNTKDKVEVELNTPAANTSFRHKDKSKKEESTKETFTAKDLLDRLTPDSTDTDIDNYIGMVYYNIPNRENILKDGVKRFLSGDDYLIGTLPENHVESIGGINLEQLAYFTSALLQGFNIYNRNAHVYLYYLIIKYLSDNTTTNMFKMARYIIRAYSCTDTQLVQFTKVSNETFDYIKSATAKPVKVSETKSNDNNSAKEDKSKKAESKDDKVKDASKESAKESNTNTKKMNGVYKDDYGCIHLGFAMPF